MQNPCKDCTARYSLCWSECEKHQAWKAEKDKIKEKERIHNKRMAPIGKKGGYV